MPSPSTTRLTVLLCTLVAGGCSSSSPSAPASAFSISGVVHESAPTAQTFLSGATVRVSGGAHPGRLTTTDGSGRFVIEGIDAVPTTLLVSKAGYDEAQYQVTSFDTAADVALSPTLAIVTEDRSFESGWNPEQGACWYYPAPSWTFPVHHTGQVKLLIAQNVGWGSASVWLERLMNDGTEASASFFFGGSGDKEWNPSGDHFFFSLVIPSGGISLDVLGGFMYRVALGKHSDLPPACWDPTSHAVWTHPN
jgi:hypothetical protein